MINRKKILGTGVPLLAGLAAVALATSSACGSGQDDASTQQEPGQTGTPSTPYANIPHGQDVHGERNFATLLNAYAEGKVEPQPWAGYWWPYKSNGIASGTYGSGGSPAGKYDAVRGGSFNAQGWEVSNHGSKVPKVDGWWGHCNGWSAAAALVREPTEPVTVNGVTFGVADQKALLTEAGMEVDADFFGERVEYYTSDQDLNQAKYDDTVPDMMFLVLTNYIGALKQAVNLDRDPGQQVWNQPLAGYRIEYPKPSDYLGADPRVPNVYRINMKTTLWWMRDDVNPGIVTPPFRFEDNDATESRLLSYELWLDGPVEFDSNGKITKSGNVIVTRDPRWSEFNIYRGGVWTNGTEDLNGRPDDMWIPYSFLKPTDYGNEHIEWQWIKDHILAGVDDTSAHPRPVPTVPNVEPSGHPTPTGTPLPWPTTTPEPTPTVTPIPTTTPIPIPTHSHHPHLD